MKTTFSHLTLIVIIAVLVGVGDAAALDRSEVQVTYDPNWTPLTGYTQHMAKSGLPGPFQIELIREEHIRGGGRILLVINSALYSPIYSAFNQYWTDLLAAGYSVEMYQTSGGTPANLRTYLQTKYNEQDGLVGVMLIGDMPVPWFEIDYDFDGPDGDELDNEYADFPCDLFYMDMDGTWLDSSSTYPFQYGVYDSHTDGSGDCAPDIWVGRLTASPMTLGGATEVDLLNNYFSKDHGFRQGDLCPAERALVYVDDDWVDTADGIDADIDACYSTHILVKDKVTTCRDDYALTRLAQSFEMMHVMLHSDPIQHFFKVNDAWEMDGANLAVVTNNNIRSYDPNAVFYNLYACSNCRYVETDYMGGWYIYTPEHGLGVVGTTKIGGMWDYTTFYNAFGQGIALGEAFTQWFEAQAPYDQGDVRWYYGMTVLGDASLCLRPQFIAGDPSRNALNVAQTASISIDFDRDMISTPCNTGSFPVRGSRSGLHYGTYSYDDLNNRHSFIPLDEFIDGETVTATLSRRVASTENVPSRGNAWSFTVGIGNPTPGTFEVGGFYEGGVGDHIYSSDLNGDGYPDLAVVTYTNDQLSVALNDGMGGFTTPTYYTVSPGPRWVTGGDFNGDGDVDLVVTNSTSQSTGTELAVFMNNGTGSFSGPTYYSSFYYPGPVIAGDYDNDGDLDLALIAGHSTQRWLTTFWNNGSGTFEYEDWQLLPGLDMGLRLQLTGDIDNDGDLDLIGLRTGSYGVADDSLFVLDNRGDRYFLPSCPCALADGPIAVCGNDFDGDGDFDFAVASAYTTTLNILLNAGDGSIATTHSFDVGGTNSRSICCGDWDGDGDIDVAQSITSPSYYMQVRKNNGDGTFAAGTDYTNWRIPSLTTGDFDRDGDLDLAMVRYGILTETLGVLVNDGSIDTAAPGKVADLSGVASMDRATAMVYWTAPGDDGFLGRAESYDLRYSTTPVGSDTLAWWGAALEAQSEPAPSLAGQPDSCSLADLEPTETYYLVLRTGDEVPNWSFFSNAFEMDPASSDVEEFAGDPVRSMLYASSPNPYRQSTLIRYALHDQAAVRLTIYDTSGRRIRRLIDSIVQQPGTHPIVWDGRDDGGRRVAAGLYFYRLEAGTFIESRRVVCLR